MLWVWLLAKPLVSFIRALLPVEVIVGVVLVVGGAELLGISLLAPLLDQGIGLVDQLVDGVISWLEGLVTDQYTFW